MPGVGIEPTCLATANFKSAAYTNFATRALQYYIVMLSYIHNSCKFIKHMSDSQLEQLKRELQSHQTELRGADSKIKDKEREVAHLKQELLRHETELTTLHGIVSSAQTKISRTSDAIRTREAAVKAQEASKKTENKH